MEFYNKEDFIFMKRLISILLSFSIIFTNVSQSRMCAVHAANPTPTPAPTLRPSEQSTNLDDIGALSLLWKLISRVVGGGIGAIKKSTIYSVSCGQRLLGVIAEVLFEDLYKTKKAKEEIEQIEKCIADEECKKVLEEILNEGVVTRSNKKKLKEIFKNL